MNRCRWCGGTLSPTPLLTTTDRLQRVPGTFTFSVCQRCGSAILDPCPTNQEAASLYEDPYLFEHLPSQGIVGVLNNFQWYCFYRRWYLQDLRHIRRLRGSGRIRLLDVGCGPGLRLKTFREGGIEAEGIEVSERFVAYATQVLNIPVRKLSPAELDRNNERFDVVTLYAVLEHVPEPRSFLKSILQLIRPGGLLVLRVPVKDASLVRLFQARHCAYSEAPRHTWIPSAQGLIRVVEQEGGKLLSQATTSLLVTAAEVAISIYPESSPALADPTSPLRYLASRMIGAGLVLLGLPLALYERLVGPSSDMDFFFQVDAR